MNPQNRIRRYAQLTTILAIVVWGLLCFLLAVSPQRSRLNRTEAELAAANRQLTDMKREIENASIIGKPAPGESRFEKFGILGADEEQLFLSDLIQFCKDTDNTLNVVRRSDVARSAAQTGQTTQSGSQQSSTVTGTSQPATAAAGSKDGQPAGPQPIVEKVPHTVNYNGTFLSSFYLLRKLEAYKRLLTVERVEIAVDSRSGYPRVNGNITIDLYLVKNPGQVAEAVARQVAAARASSAANAAGATTEEQTQP
jgi:type II secretory pathway component PulJ